MKNTNYTCDRCGHEMSYAFRRMNLLDSCGKTMFSAHLCEPCAEIVRTEAFIMTQSLIDAGEIE